MPAKDIYHDTVKNSLTNEDWKVTHEHYLIKLADSHINMYIDLAAERVIAAEKGNEKIAVEVKSFTGTSLINEFHEALGQFLDYRIALREKDPDRTLYLAVSLDIYRTFFSRRFIQTVCQEYQIKILIFDPAKEEIDSWIN